MKKEEIYMMMLQVLDDPEAVRIIVETSYPNLSEGGNAYFMVDRSDAVFAVDSEPKVYDHWRVYDSIGQVRDFQSHAELIEFLGSIEDIITRAWVESY